MYRLLKFYLENVLYLTGFYIYLLGINDRTKTLICILMIEFFFFFRESLKICCLSTLIIRDLTSDFFFSSFPLLKGRQTSLSYNKTVQKVMKNVICLLTSFSVHLLC